NIDFQEIEKPDYVSLVETLPEFLIARYSLESSKFQTAKTKGAWLPEISFSASASRSGSQWTPERDGWNAGISVSYQLFNGGARYADTKTALNNLKIAEENIKETLNSLKAKAVANYNSLSDAFENIAVRQHYLKASSLQAEISAKKYVNGLSTYQDWYSIENDFINSQKTLLDVKKAAALEMAQWNNFKGAGFGSFANDNILAPVSE
ncbi:MAG: TolC family protein, partial [Endomicrobium sp.]|nr:TolC family protein [Endomicrobium sp.]